VVTGDLVVVVGIVVVVVLGIGVVVPVAFEFVVEPVVVVTGIIVGKVVVEL